MTGSANTRGVDHEGKKYGWRSARGIKCQPESRIRRGAWSTQDSGCGKRACDAYRSSALRGTVGLRWNPRTTSHGAQRCRSVALRQVPNDLGDARGATWETHPLFPKGGDGLRKLRIRRNALDENGQSQALLFALQRAHDLRSRTLQWQDEAMSVYELVRMLEK